jgi:nicotinamide mononucleotide transporter
MLISWIKEHWVELFGAISGLIYIYFSIRENILLWATGIISSAVYIYVFFASKFYADMSLQFYYLIISIYGWILWAKGKNNTTKKEEIKIIKTPQTIYLVLMVASFVLFLLIGLILDNLTDSPLPYWDALTTALSITATWMLAKKFIEQWLIWIFVDALSAGLYIYKNLYPTAVLFVVFTIMAVVGYFQWRKIMLENAKEF